LNKILEEEWARFRKERKRALDEAVERELKSARTAVVYEKEGDEEKRKRVLHYLENSPDFRERKEYFIYLKNGPVAKVADFTAALREPDLQDKEPNGLLAKVFNVHSNHNAGICIRKLHVAAN
jgi:hypothetical protein